MSVQKKTETLRKAQPAQQDAWYAPEGDAQVKIRLRALSAVEEMYTYFGADRA